MDQSERISPARTALLIQLGATALAWGAWMPGSVSAPTAVALQVGTAVLLSMLLRQPRWWWLIHLAFLPAVLLARQWTLPAWWYLLALLLSWGLFGAVHRSRVPLYLTSQAALDALETCLPAQGRVLDVGAGTATVLHRLARHANLQVSGIEHAWLPWALGWLRLRLSRSSAVLHRGDWTRLSLADYDAVYAFLSPAAMPGLWQQARAQMPRGSVLISNRFEIPGVMADRELRYGNAAEHRLLIWYMPGPKAPADQ